MVNQSVNELYIRFLFKVDATPQDIAFLLDNSEKVSNNLSPNVREFLILEGVQVPPMSPTETNHQGEQRLILVRNVSVEAENKIRIIKAEVQLASGSRHLRTFVVLLGGNS